MTCIDGINGNNRQHWVCDVCGGKGCPDPRDEELTRLRARLADAAMLLRIVYAGKFQFYEDQLRKWLEEDQ